jgi:predicted AAA+ superfamily ATPase
MANLARELEVAQPTVRSWLGQRKRLYLLFPVSPWTKKISRGLKKENKWYFLDWYYVPEGPARLENAVATYLFRACLALTDMGYGNFNLHYIRTLEKKEIDFVVAADNRPILTVEVKSGDAKLSKTLLNRDSWFHNTQPLGIQVVDKRGVLQKHSDHTWVIGIERFLSLLI